MIDFEEEDQQEQAPVLYQHVKHPHQPQNVNVVHKERHQAAGLNTRIAVLLTKAVGTMWTAYLFTILAIVGLFGLLGLLNPFTFLLATWLSQQFIQLVFLPILSVGQSVLGKHAETMAEEQFNTTQRSFHDIEQIMAHLDAQDTKILGMEQLILQQGDHIELLIRGMDNSRSRLVKNGMKSAKQEHQGIGNITQEVQAVLVKSKSV